MHKERVIGTSSQVWLRGLYLKHTLYSLWSQCLSPPGQSPVWECLSPVFLKVSGFILALRFPPVSMNWPPRYTSNWKILDWSVKLLYFYTLLQFDHGVLMTGLKMDLNVLLPSLKSFLSRSKSENACKITCWSSVLWYYTLGFLYHILEPTSMAICEMLLILA